MFRGWRRKTALVVGMVLTSAFCCAPAWQNFVWFGTRSMMGEAKGNLSGLCNAQLKRIAEGKPAHHYQELGFPIPDGNRYGYFVAQGAELEVPRKRSADPAQPGAALGSATATGVQVDLNKFGSHSVERAVTDRDLPPRFGGNLVLGQNGTCPECCFVFAGAGNIDGDPELDIWSVATCPRTAPDGTPVPPCVPFHEQDEVPSPYWWRR